MTQRIGVAVMAAALLLYLLLAVGLGATLIAAGTTAGIVGGLALVFFPLLGFWALWRELSFGWRTQRLADRLAAEGGLPVETEVRASGRPAREAADATFPQYRAEVEASPESWRAWFRLSLAYDASGDRSRARWAAREALRLERAERLNRLAT